MIRVVTLLILAAGALWLAGCDPTEQTPCEPACEQGLSCDTATGTCRAPRLSAYRGALPGRSARLAVLGERVFAAAIDPDTDQLVVGRVDTDTPSAYVLAELGRAKHRRPVLDANDTTLVAGWLADDDTYRLAVHQRGQTPDRWQTLPPVIFDDDDYRGSEHFDVDLSDSGRLQLVFHDRRRRTLRRVSGRIDALDWQIDTVDDPDEAANESICSSQQRRLAGRGVGYYPDVVVHSGATFVAYQDGDCGDLRLARRIDGQWVSAVVDTGDFDRKDGGSLTRGDTGKFASIGFDSAGNLAIAYQDASRGRLAVAFEQNGQFLIEVADEGLELDSASRRRKHLVGAFASLVFDDDDIPWIAYLDQTNLRLRLAHRSRGVDLDGTWIHRTVDDAIPGGYSASLVFLPTRGLMLAAEHLRPHAGGLNSELHVTAEEEL